MFSLIISIISIALVAALAAATVYFGGAAFNKGSAGADASTFINAGQQVAGAFTLSAADGYSATTVQSLNNGLLGSSDGVKADGQVYLAQIPTYKGTALTTFNTKPAYISLDVSGQVCDEINKRSHGNSYVFATVKTAGVDGLYGCVGGTDISSTGTAFYKVK
jgi:hypothetical protein